MPNLNKVMLMGNITRDFDVRYSAKGSAVAEIGLAVNRSWTDDSGQKQEETTFVDITFFGKQAETLGKYVGKGSPIYVEGRLQLDTWQDKESGQNRSKLKIVGYAFQFLGGKRDEGQSRPSQEYDSNPPGRPGGSPANVPQVDLNDDDEIPF